jgi:hypothetical protein
VAEDVGALRTVNVPVPSVASMGISFAYGVGLGIMGLFVYFLGVGTFEVLTCGSSATGADYGCSLGPGLGTLLVLLSILFMIGSAFGLVDGERMYSLRSRAREQELSSSETRSGATRVSMGSRPCPVCGHGNRAEFVYCQSCGKQIPPIP